MVWNSLTGGSFEPISDVSTLVCCWSAVSTRRTIYKFINESPFDYTDVAVSGKVWYIVRVNRFNKTN